jgi:hypothetical protein
LVHSIKKEKLMSKNALKLNLEKYEFAAVLPCLLNPESDLSNIPHTWMNDLAVGYQLVTGDGGAKKHHYIITKDEATAEELAEMVKKTPRDAYEVEVVPIENIIGVVPGLDSGLLVVSNADGTLGAGVIAADGLLDELANKMGGSFYMLPSSIHEVLITKDSEASKMPGLGDDIEEIAKGLNEMVREVNENEVKPEDVLSDHAYHYDAKERLFETADEYAEREKGLEESL